MSAPGPAPSLQLSSYGQPLQPGSGPHDCRQSSHGCCPDGHTASLGPQWQGCPGASLCQQSRWVPLPPPQVREGRCVFRVGVSDGRGSVSAQSGWGGLAELRSGTPGLLCLSCPVWAELGTWLPPPPTELPPPPTELPNLLGGGKSPPPPPPAARSLCGDQPVEM